MIVLATGDVSRRGSRGMAAKVMGIINYITYIAHGPHDANVLSRDDV